MNWRELPSWFWFVSGANALFWLTLGRPLWRYGIYLGGIRSRSRSFQGFEYDWPLGIALIVGIPVGLYALLHFFPELPEKLKNKLERFVNQNKKQQKANLSKIAESSPSKENQVDHSHKPSGIGRIAFFLIILPGMYLGLVGASYPPAGPFLGTWIFFFALIFRLRNIGRTPAWAFLALVPLLNVPAMVYGQVCPPNRNWKGETLLSKVVSILASVLVGALSLFLVVFAFLMKGRLEGRL